MERARSFFRNTAMGVQASIKAIPLGSQHSSAPKGGREGAVCGHFSAKAVGPKALSLSRSASRSEEHTYHDEMALDSAFVIAAAPAAIWVALWAELTEGDPHAFSVEQSGGTTLLSLTFDLTGMAACITYRINGRQNQSEIWASLDPL